MQMRLLLKWNRMDLWAEQFWAIAIQVMLIASQLMRLKSCDYPRDYVSCRDSEMIVPWLLRKYSVRYHDYRISCNALVSRYRSEDLLVDRDPNMDNGFQQMIFRS